MTRESFDQWCVVEVMGHKKFAGRVTEGPFGLVRIDIPEVTLPSGQILSPFTKMLGANAIYAMTPCTEETARAFAAALRSEAFQAYELPTLSAPKPIVRATDERDPEWDAEYDDEALRKATVITEAEFFAGLGVDRPAMDDDDGEPF